MASSTPASMGTGPAPGGPLTVAHVVLSLDVGGLERVVLDLVRRGVASGQEVAVVCLERPGTLAPDAERAGARVFCVDKPPGRRPETVGRLRAVFQEFRPDVIHTHQIGALFYAGPAAHQAGIAAVVHTEHINHALKRVGVLDRAKMLALWAVAGRHARRFFGVSGDIVGAVAATRAVARSRLAVVPNGIDTGAFLASPQARDESAQKLASLGVSRGARVVSTVGRLAEVKRHDRLIRAFAAAAARRPDAALVIVGEGPERPALESLARALAPAIRGRVHFAGYQRRPEVFLGGTDVFALASRLEGMPLAILEAWAAGVPVVASRVGGIPALVEHGRTGLLFDPDDEAALAAHLEALLDDPGRARTMGEAGRARAVAEFDAGVMAAAYDHHYREVLAASRSRDR